MEDFLKAQKYLKSDMLVLLILNLVLVVFSYQRIFFIIFSLIGFITAKKGVKVAGIIGIIFGILMLITIFTFDLIDALLGLFVLLHSLKYNKLIKNI